MGTPHHIVNKPQLNGWGLLLPTTYQTELRIEDGTAFGRKRQFQQKYLGKLVR